MLEPAVVLHQFVEHLLTRVTEGRMPEIVCESDAFRQVLVEPQRPRDAATDARHLNRVGQPRAEMIACAVQKYLRLIFQPPKRAAVDDPVAVTLEIRAQGMLRLVKRSSARIR